MQSLANDAFPKLLKGLPEKRLDANKGSQILISGFRKSGLYPFDPLQPKQRLPPEENPSEATSLVSSAIVDMLKEMHGCAELDTTKQRRKRVKVEPGKSVTVEDFVLRLVARFHQREK